ncbi:conserved hypothetical protein [Streptomyces filamentosus NRRL 15998]|uniref:Uncharacterized protein n=1 Tax=Streptomyces filamentosus NRRL 15998 TaxID=457431 RepID=D6ARG9_STRFL|nr:conserved hypothetical protein [Streptomyces filamentosus NRRL 15998]
MDSSPAARALRTGLRKDRLEHQEPFHQAQEHGRVAQQIVGVTPAGGSRHTGLRAGPAVGARGEEGAPFGQLRGYLREDFPGAADPVAAALVRLGAPAGGQHGRRDAQGGEVGGGVPLVGLAEHGGLVEAGAGLGKQIQGGGRRRGAAQDGVDIGGRTGQ